MPPMQKLLSIPALLGLAALLACGGGGGSNSNSNPTNATSLAYTDPTGGTYLLKKNTALSTTTHLVLDLVGPAGATGSGISASLSADPTKVTWTNVGATDAAGTYVQNGAVFILGTAPQILKAKVASGVLQVTVAQKGAGSPVAMNAPLLRLALDLNGLTAQGAVTLSADATKCLVLDGTGALTPMTVTVGTLNAQ